MSLYALTKASTLVLTAEVSFVTVISAGVVVTFSAVNVTPDTVLAKVLLGEVTAMPFTVAAASVATCVVMGSWVVTTLVSGSVVEVPTTSLDKPDRSAVLPSISDVTDKVKAAAVPVEVLRKSNLSPVASVSTDAVTPAPAPLMLLAMSTSVSVAKTVMDTGAPLPTVKLRVPSPMAVPFVKPADAVDLAAASVCTATLNDVGCVPPMALTLTAALSDDVAETALQPVTLVSLLTVSDKVETKDLSCPNAEILV